MSAVLPDLNVVQAIVIDAAKQELLPRFTHSAREYKADGSIVTEADRAVQQSIESALKAQWPEYLFVGEEMTESEQIALLNTKGQGVWCLDPVDGTSNFAGGVPFCAVSLSLLKDGEVLMGVVYDPMRDECFTAIKGEGSWLNGEAHNATSVPLHWSGAGSPPGVATSTCMDGSVSGTMVLPDWCCTKPVVTRSRLRVSRYCQ